MQYLTNYYKNLAEQLQTRINDLQEQLSLVEGKEEMDKASKSNTQLEEPNLRKDDKAKEVPATIVRKKVSKEEKEEQDKKNKEMELPESSNPSLFGAIKNILEATRKKKLSKEELAAVAEPTDKITRRDIITLAQKNKSE